MAHDHDRRHDRPGGQMNKEQGAITEGRMSKNVASVDVRIAALEHKMRRVLRWVIGMTLAFLIGLTAGVIGYVKSHDDAVRRNCETGQHFITAIQIAIPQHPVDGRTPAQQANVDKFYAKLDQAGILHPQDCSTS